MVSGEHGIGEGKTRKAVRGKDNRTGQFTCRWHGPVIVFKLRADFGPTYLQTYGRIAILFVETNGSYRVCLVSPVQLMDLLKQTS
jgi:hypothetical protein